MAEITSLEIDIESFSSVDLKKCGVYMLTLHASYTKVLF